ncbi:MAG: trehalose-phosphatase [Actinobacteria bacterium]|nr:trehalose-phosphatase [Actinomycetota bacterium]
MNDLPADDLIYDEPSALADLVAALPAPLVLCTDIDGTLSAITPVPGEARLVDGARDALRTLAANGVEVAAVSGRTLAELVRQFELPRTLHLIGSHGVEFEQNAPRTEAEGQLLEQIDELLGDVAARHEGAVLERKPFGSALHVRRCEPDSGEVALAEAAAAVDGIEGVHVLPGHRVYEVVVRAVTKVDAVAELRRRLDPASMVFVGDDRSDELVFASFAAAAEADRANLISVKVGTGPSVATHRLRSPDDTVAFLEALVKLLVD